MTTLEGYVVIPALFREVGGPEAQVGDQIKLYLDTDAQPDFPEFILGVIQHPILRSCDGKSYSVLYDEDDLLGAAESIHPDDVVSAEIVSCCDILRDDLNTEIARAEAAEAAIREDLNAIEFAGSDPNIPDVLTITGIDDPPDSDPLALERVADAGARPAWEVTDGDNSWECRNATGNAWEVFDLAASYHAQKSSSSQTPVGLTGWAVDTGSGQLVITGDAPVAAYLGQWCKAATAWWQWDGTAWIPRHLLNGKQVTRDDADTAYFTLGVDNIGLPTTTPFP